MAFSPHLRPPRPEVRVFLDDIREHPEDDTPRLILADWLQDQSDPVDQARGEFIRLQCLIAQAGRVAEESWQRRADYLLRFHITEWLGPMQQWAQQWAFRRGLLHLILGGQTWFKPELLGHVRTEGWAWVEGLTFVNFTGSGVNALTQHPVLAGKRSLTFQESRLGDPGLQALARSPHLRDLAELHLGMNRLRDDGLAVLAELGNTPMLETLDLAGNWMTGEGLRALARNVNHLSKLRSLDLSFIDLANDDLNALVGTDLLHQLEVLKLRGNRQLNSEGLAALVNCPEVSNLRILDLGQTALRTEVLQVLARSPHLGQVRRLHLERSRLFDEAIKHLGFSEGLPRLEELYAGRNHLTDAGVVALAQGTIKRNWRVLHLDGNHIGREGAEAIANCPSMTELTDLSLDDNHIGDEGALALARSPFLDRLTYLDVGRNGLGPAGHGVLLRRFGRGVVLV